MIPITGLPDPNSIIRRSPSYNWSAVILLSVNDMFAQYQDGIEDAVYLSPDRVFADIP